MRRNRKMRLGGKKSEIRGNEALKIENRRKSSRSKKRKEIRKKRLREKHWNERVSKQRAR